MSKFKATGSTNRLENLRYSREYNEFFALYEEDYTEEDINTYVDSLGLSPTMSHNLKLAIRTA